VAENVVDLVEAGLETELAHPPGQPAAGVDVGPRPGQPVHAAVRAASEAGELGQAGLEPVS